jgi:hypothetical protein
MIGTVLQSAVSSLNLRVQPPRAYLGLCVLLLASCSREPEPVSPHRAATLQPAPAGQSASSAAQPSFELPYPRASWRLAPASELSDVVLWFSQILIRHADARNEVSFNLAYWSSALPPATRSREQALERARQLAQQAALNPAGFADLARRYSEDLPRRDEGGAMGGVQASQIVVWPQVLDALAAIAPGQTSRVVESPYGFHIFLRSAPPAEQVLSGAHIVIGHDQAKWLGVYARGERASRSRDEALALSRELQARARSAPERFAELVDQYSEHRDAVVGGDFGAWSTREPSAFAPRMKRLRELQIGEVGPPIETHLGFEVIQRTAPRPRAQFRARVFVHSGPLSSGPPDAAAERELLEQANALAPSLADHPARFEQLAGEVLQWEDGRGIPGLSLLLPALHPGQITRSAVASEYGPVIAQRLEPEPVSAKRFATELPAPERPDAERFLADLSAQELEGFLQATVQHARATLGLSDAVAERLRGVHQLRGRFADDALPELRLSLIHDLLEQTRQLLPADAYARYRADLDEHVQGLLLHPASDSQAPLGL